MKITKIENKHDLKIYELNSLECRHSHRVSYFQYRDYSTVLKMQTE